MSTQTPADKARDKLSAQSCIIYRRARNGDAVQLAQHHLNCAEGKQSQDLGPKRHLRPAEVLHYELQAVLAQRGRLIECLRYLCSRVHPDMNSARKLLAEIDDERI